MILAIDQGTTGTTCLVVDEELHVHRRGYAEVPQHFPRPGWVEHDPEELWQSVLDAAGQAGLNGVDTIAITNQRETTLLWERSTGRPVAPAIVWHDRRTAERCRELDSDLLRERTGLSPIRTSPPRSSSGSSTSTAAPTLHSARSTPGSSGSSRAGQCT